MSATNSCRDCRPRRLRLPGRRTARLAEAVEASVDELHLLINNAGIGTGLPESRERQESLDGNELRFAVNYLAGFLLTERLLPLLRRQRARANRQRRVARAAPGSTSTTR